MKKILPIILMIPIIFVMIVLMQSLFYPLVSKETEAKYLRNIDKFYPISDNQLCCNVQGGDSLAYVAHTTYSLIDPFHKWYIGRGIGGIRANGELSRKLDSLAALYVNKLK